jgi:hypothetical protein
MKDQGVCQKPAIVVAGEGRKDGKQAFGAPFIETNL